MTTSSEGGTAPGQEGAQVEGVFAPAPASSNGNAASPSSRPSPPGLPSVEMPPLDARPSLRRRASSVAFWLGCVLALALLVAPAVSILEGVVARAAPHWHWSVLTTLGVGLSGGLENEIVGTWSWW